MLGDQKKLHFDALSCSVCFYGHVFLKFPCNWLRHCAREDFLFLVRFLGSGWVKTVFYALPHIIYGHARHCPENGATFSANANVRKRQYIPMQELFFCQTLRAQCEQPADDNTPGLKTVQWIIDGCLENPGVWRIIRKRFLKMQFHVRPSRTFPKVGGGRGLEEIIFLRDERRYVFSGELVGIYYTAVWHGFEFWLLSLDPLVRSEAFAVLYFWALCPCGTTRCAQRLERWVDGHPHEAAVLIASRLLNFALARQKRYMATKI